MSYPAGTIIIKQSERMLYFTTGTGTAVRYPIAIGRAGKAWQGETFVQGKFFSPAWSAPAVVRHDHPNFPAVIPGGSPRNPMGAAAITLNLSEVAIHGTTASMRRSVGTAASYGCIRMYNEDVMDLYHRVQCRNSGRRYSLIGRFPVRGLKSDRRQRAGHLARLGNCRCTAACRGLYFRLGLV